MGLQSYVSNVQCTNGASLKVNTWLQPASVNMEQFKLPSVLILIGSLTIVSQYIKDYNKSCQEYLLLHFSFLVLSYVSGIYVYGGGWIASWFPILQIYINVLLMH